LRIRDAADQDRFRQKRREYQQKRRAKKKLARPVLPQKCINCEEIFENPRSLFCGERCRQIAELVRYARRKISEGTFERPDIALAIRTRSSLLIHSFYDKRGRAVPEAKRARLLERSGGKCEKCGSEFTPDGDQRFTVQHTALEDEWFLEAWCFRCNMEHAQSVPIEMTEEDYAFIGFLELRFRALKPVLICDDPVMWPKQWQLLLKCRKKASTGHFSKETS
jgi:hypothetical protein